LPPLARELAYKIRNRHLTRDQYRELRKGPVGDALMRLRARGILTPLSSVEDQSDPVYWFPPEKSDRLVSAAILSRPMQKEAEEVVRNELARVGYVPKPSEGNRSG
jgi:hypothetical protein